jgi:MOSC domain-containing protein YiiM
MALGICAVYTVPMITSLLDGLFIGKPSHFRSDGAMSSIGSRVAAEGPVKLGFLGFEGDAVGDPSVHGGPDKAVHYYPAEHYEAWRGDGPAHPLLDQLGGFGENLCGEGLTEEKVHIGDRFRIGTALLEISQGRQPCWKIDHHFGRKGMTAAVIKTGRSGFYFRVIEEGEIALGDAIEQVYRMTHGWTVERAFQMLIGGYHKLDGAKAALEELADMETLASTWRQRALQLMKAA